MGVGPHYLKRDFSSEDRALPPDPFSLFSAMCGLLLFFLECAGKESSTRRRSGRAERCGARRTSLPAALQKWRVFPRAARAARSMSVRFGVRPAFHENRHGDAAPILGQAGIEHDILAQAHGVMGAVLVIVGVAQAGPGPAVVQVVGGVIPAAVEGRGVPGGISGGRYQEANGVRLTGSGLAILQMAKDHACAHGV